MRAWVLAGLLVALAIPTSTEATAIPSDLIVLVDPSAGVPLPQGAVALHVVPGFILPGGTDAEARSLRSTAGILSVERAVPLELHDAALEGPGSDLALRLTRADPASLASFQADGTGIGVAIVDTGVDATQPDLLGRVASSWRLIKGTFVEGAGDLDGHGTHVAGIVAASGATSNGVHVGTAPGAKLVSLDIHNDFSTASALLAYDWMHLHHKEQGIRVVVNSWGRIGEGRFDPRDAEIRAIDQLVEDGVVVIFSASNHGPGAKTLSLEAQDPRVITVGAVDDAALIASYSSRGPVRPISGADWVKPDVVAPGDHIIGLRSQQAPPSPSDPDAMHHILSGTSQAAPHVAGIVARMLSAHPAMSPNEVSDALHESAIDMGAAGPDPVYGFGLVDAPDALRVANSAPPARDNPLAAGGVETYDDATTLDATTHGVLGLASNRDAVWETRIPLKAGAQGFSFELSTSTSARALTADLRGPDGATATYTAAEQEGARTVLRGRLDAPTAGVWTLRAHASVPLAADLASHAEVALGRNATRALPLDARYHLPDPPVDAAPARTFFGNAALLAQAHPWALLVGLALLTSPLLAWLARPSKPRGPVAPAPPPTEPSRDEPT